MSMKQAMSKNYNPKEKSLCLCYGLIMQYRILFPFAIKSVDYAFCFMKI